MRRSDCFKLVFSDGNAEATQKVACFKKQVQNVHLQKQNNTFKGNFVTVLKVISFNI